jgi:hypothetical protein
MEINHINIVYAKSEEVIYLYLRKVHLLIEAEHVNFHVQNKNGSFCRNYILSPNYIPCPKK